MACHNQIYIVHTCLVYNSLASHSELKGGQNSVYK